MFEHQIITLALDDGMYQALEQAIHVSVKQADKEPQRRKPAKRGHGIPPEQLDHILSMAEMAYFNEEWSEAVKIYTGLLESGVDLPPFVDARLALCFSSMNDWEASFDHAVKSYETHPAEAAAYVAMAKNTIILASLPESGLRWLQLASQALNIPKNVMKELKLELEETIIVSTSCPFCFCSCCPSECHLTQFTFDHTSLLQMNKKSAMLCHSCSRYESKVLPSITADLHTSMLTSYH
jgi:hypothetical protein